MMGRRGCGQDLDDVIPPDNNQTLLLGLRSLKESSSYLYARHSTTADVLRVAIHAAGRCPGCEGQPADMLKNLPKCWVRSLELASVVSKGGPEALAHCGPARWGPQWWAAHGRPQ